MRSINQILEADLAKNHAGRGYGLDRANERIEQWMKAGGDIWMEPNVLIAWRALDDTRMEFHCFNAGSGRELVQAIHNLLARQRGRFAQAITLYDNERINDLVKHCKYPAQVDHINAGTDMTWCLTIDLRD
jgi:hypothetical protein